MVDHKIVRSVDKPEEMVIDEFSVWIATDIKQVKVKDESGERTEYEYHLMQYDKDEFIQLTTKNIEADVTSTQVALCDVYEALTAKAGV